MLVGLVLLGCVSPTRVHELEWLEARTDHFRIWSALGEERTLALARDLELFRALVERTANATPVEQAPPVSIYAFPSAWSYGSFGPSDSIGFFEEDMRGNHMAIQGGTRADETEILKHEYVHYVLASGRISYPRWYHEGFAEFLATAQVEGIASKSERRQKGSPTPRAGTRTGRTHSRAPASPHTNSAMRRRLGSIWSRLWPKIQTTR